MTPFDPVTLSDPSRKPHFLIRRGTSWGTLPGKVNVNRDGNSAGEGGALTQENAYHRIGLTPR